MDTKHRYSFPVIVFGHKKPKSRQKRDKKRIDYLSRTVASDTPQKRKMGKFLT